MNPKRRIALLSSDRALQDILELRLQSKGDQVVSLPESSQVLGFIYSDPPDVIIVDFSSQDPTFQKILKQLKQDSYFSHIPIIGLLGPWAVEGIEWEQFPLDDYTFFPVNYVELFSRILLSFQRLHRVFDNNPLTKLPGNTSIQQAIERVLGTAMAVCYVDINYFKPFNDTYGFSRGDEVIRMVARIMSNTVKDSMSDGFVGHIGGDDFVFIVPIEQAEQVCKTIIANFKVIVSDLFGEEEKARGFYWAKDRKGEIQKVPLLGISIAVVPTNNPEVNHFGKVAEVAAELKKLAKKSQESCYVIDQRKA